MRRIFVGIATLLVAPAGLVAAAPVLAERALAAEGVTARVAWCGDGLCLADVTRGGVHATRVVVGWRGAVRVEGVTVPLADALALAGGALGGAGSTGAPEVSAVAAGPDAGRGADGADGAGVPSWARRFVRSVDVTDLSVPGAPLPRLAGRVWPDRRLAGEGVVIEGETVRVAVDTSLGAAELEATRADGGLALVARCAACTLPAPGPQDAPLPLPPVTARGTWADGRFDGAVRVEAIEARLVARPDGGGVVADLTLADTPIADVYALFGAWVPEARRARIEGTVAFNARVQWRGDADMGALGALAGAAVDEAAPAGASVAGGAATEAPEAAEAERPDPDAADPVAPRGLEILSFTPTITDVTVDGLLPDTLRGGPFQFLGRGPDGEDVVFTRGEGTPEWVSLAELGIWLPAAVIAAEDGTFRGHTGYSLAGIAEAATYNAEKGAIRRGGSTLTQQLAKNLFLDGTRSYARKLRELLYAVELERELGKARILELYVNVVEFAPGIRGAKPAADLYFFKAPAGLLPEEAAWLADILRYPSTAFSRQYLAGRVDQGRVRWILENMQGVPEEARAAALARPVRLVPPARASAR